MKEACGRRGDQKWKRRSDEDARGSQEDELLFSVPDPGSRGTQNDTRNFNDDTEFQEELDQNRRPINLLIQTMEAIFEKQIQGRVEHRFEAHENGEDREIPPPASDHENCKQGSIAK